MVRDDFSFLYAPCCADLDETIIAASLFSFYFYQYTVQKQQHFIADFQ
ncbi:hypothetical protein CPter291_2079 [Collimonas pratensis]|uniref:Uncharacterized protein n=1 Tax=Collimonas pratensis TaxID=279113 RepID=A0ABN4M7V9_9BURK|nr:hypothetical protein CPter291_2079 [Collimonas pratensis]